MNKKQKMRWKPLILLLCGMLYLNMVPVFGVYAASLADGESVEFVNSPGQSTYTVAYGTALADIGLPDELTVGIRMPAFEEGGEESTRTDTAAVEWTGSYDPETVGTYTLVANFTEGLLYTPMPTVEVTVSAVEASVEETAPTAIQATLDSLSIPDANQFRAQYYEFHEVNVTWSCPGPIKEGDYLTLEIDPELNLHPNTLEQLENLTYNTEIIATPSAIYQGSDYGDHTSIDSITYTFTSAAEKYRDFSGSLTFNVSVKTALDGFVDWNNDGNSDVYRSGNTWLYHEGTVQPVSFKIGDSVKTTNITHLAYPTVPESIFHINSWYNTTVLDHSIEWNPSITGDFIHAFVEVFQADQYQDKNIDSYPLARDIKVNIQLDIEDGTFVTDGGVKIAERVWDEVSQQYVETGIKYYTFEELGYVEGEDHFDVDIGVLYPNPKPKNVSYSIQYYINHISAIPYKDIAGDPNNMVNLTFIADLNGVYEPDIDEIIHFQDGAFWFPTRSTNLADMNVNPLYEFITLKIIKNWSPNLDTLKSDICFELRADGETPQVYDWTLGVYRDLTQEDLILQKESTSMELMYLAYRNPNTGTPYRYTLNEQPVDGFSSVIEEDGYTFTVTNTYSPPKSYIYRIIGNYYTYRNGTLVNSQEGVNLSGTTEGYLIGSANKIVSAVPGNYENLNGVAFQFDDENTKNVVSVTLGEGDHLYTVVLNYVRNLSAGNDGEDDEDSTFYYCIDYVYTGYDAGGNQTYSNSVIGSVQTTDESIHSFTAANTVSYDGHTFFLVGDSNRSASLAGTSKNTPYVFTVYYKCTSLIDAGTFNGTAPATGDNMGPWAIIAAMSSMGLAWLFHINKKHAGEKP